MIKGTLKWEEIIIREIEPEELTSVINELVNDEVDYMEIEPEVTGTFSVSYKNLLQGWEDI